jgi:ribonucleoside-diphosphate reductase alpha chain
MASSTRQAARTVHRLRMLDNVVDINFYATPKARNANLRHRPVGLGIMGFADCLHELGMPYASAAAVEFADRTMEAVCYHAYSASTELAERARPLFQLHRQPVGPRHPAARLP